MQESRYKMMVEATVGAVGMERGGWVQGCFGGGVRRTF